MSYFSAATTTRVTYCEIDRISFAARSSTASRLRCLSGRLTVKVRPAPRCSHRARHRGLRQAWGGSNTIDRSNWDVYIGLRDPRNHMQDGRADMDGPRTRERIRGGFLACRDARLLIEPNSKEGRICLVSTVR